MESIELYAEGISRTVSKYEKRAFTNEDNKDDVSGIEISASEGKSRISFNTFEDMARFQLELNIISGQMMTEKFIEERAILEPGFENNTYTEGQFVRYAYRGKVSTDYYVVVSDSETTPPGHCELKGKSGSCRGHLVTVDTRLVSFMNFSVSGDGANPDTDDYLVLQLKKRGIIV